jgi:membrane-bound metal-dependent hydrolase YbcI (DUF457 family)
MATPLGHYLVGLSITQTIARSGHEKRQVFLMAAIACIPDLDIVPGIIVGKLNRFHHGASHSFTAAAIVSMGVGLLFKKWTGTLDYKFVVLCFALYSSHVLLDFLSLDPGVVSGVPLFWPWDNHTYQSNWVLLPNVQHSSGPIMSRHNFLLMIRELFIFLPLVGFCEACKVSNWRCPSAMAYVYGAWLFLAVWVSLFYVS